VRDLDITMSQGGVIAALMDFPDGKATLKELEKRLQLSQSVTAGLVSRLEKRGYVESFGSEEDRRIKIIKATTSGIEKCQAAQKVLIQVEKEFLAPLTDADKNDMYRIFTKLLNANQ
ncbi:MAG: MarR family winged helix-turn-helix transcriptional regulator, partial [Eubacterium sp.]